MISISNYNKQAELILKDYLNGVSLDVIYSKYNKNLAQTVIYTEINNHNITAIGYLNKDIQEIYPKYKKNIPVEILCSDYGVDAVLCFLLLNFLQTKKVNPNDLLVCKIIKNREISNNLEILKSRVNKLFGICRCIFVMMLILGFKLCVTT